MFLSEARTTIIPSSKTFNIKEVTFLQLKDIRLVFPGHTYEETYSVLDGILSWRHGWCKNYSCFQSKRHSLLQTNVLE